MLKMNKVVSDGVSLTDNETNYEHISEFFLQICWGMIHVGLVAFVMIAVFASLFWFVNFLMKKFDDHEDRK